MSEIVRNYPLDRILRPMKPCRVGNSVNAQRRLKQALTSELYIAEEKIDGCHYLSIGGRIFSTQMSRKDNLPVEKTLQVQHIHKTLSKLGPNVILDGEIYQPGWKSQDVVRVMGSYPDIAKAKQEDFGFLHYMVFDILRDANGKWLTNLPWHKRRKILEQYFSEDILVNDSFIELSPIIVYNKERFLDDVLASGREGIVLKHIDELYYPGKRPMWNWIKVKCEMTDDVIILGFEPPVREYTGKDIENWEYWQTQDGTILVGKHYGTSGLTAVTKYYAMGWIGSIVFGKLDKDGNPVVLGTCSGFDEDLRREFSCDSERFIGQVIKIKAMEKTRDGAYRHPSFLSIHGDKNAEECIIDSEVS